MNKVYGSGHSNFGVEPMLECTQIQLATEIPNLCDVWYVTEPIFLCANVTFELKRTLAFHKSNFQGICSRDIVWLV